jgi:3-oxoadipate enol-lactonase
MIEDGVIDGIAYRAAGSRTASALVFLHGIGGAARAFDPQLDYFSKSHRVVAWDMPGYGRSTLPPLPTIAAQADACARLLKGLQLDRPILAGHSIGGMITQEVQARKLHPLGGLILIATSPAFGSSNGEWQRAFLDARLGPLDRGQTLAGMAESIVENLVGDDPDPEGCRLAVDCMGAVPPDTYRVTVKSLIGFDRRAALGQIDVPTLVLAGNRDGNAPADMMQRMAEKIPRCRYACLDSVGHLPNLEWPDGFNGAVEDLLKLL